MQTVLVKVYQAKALTTLEHSTKNILKNLFAISPEEASLSPLYLALSTNLKNTNGKYFYKLKEKNSSIDSYDIDLANKVWVKSLEYIK